MKLTREQINEAKAEMVNASQTKPCRFMCNGQNLNICTGELLPKGTNVIDQLVYWQFTKETANKIAKWLDCKIVWSE